MQSITNIGANSNIFAKAIKTEPINSQEKNDFSQIIENAIHKVNDSQVNANSAIEGLIKGEDVSMHNVMLSVQESQMSMQLMLEVRNKLYEAYQEVNRVQL
ncbi:flagellar hook-basal body complex protein FliE [[Clostridium] dakarense]|uniref:flagellar hook-basal body complex protein FliE n=1 Tax=Faecalimicrobium dakarense TaxID=1301100 RepID=UPI0004AD877A|nr:flagellar hook-basal body complex protein FliE [[Clostridium] dakarense]